MDISAVRRIARISRSVTLLALPAALLLGCASAQKAGDEPKPPTLMEWDDFGTTSDGRVWLAGQPSEAALDRFSAETRGGGGLVVNLRTDNERAFLPYYGRSVAARGLRYAEIPTSGSTLGPETVAAYREAVRGHQGPVLLHCASAGRATYLWAMLRMEDEGLSADEAIAWAEERRGKPWEKGADLLRAFGGEPVE